MIGYLLRGYAKQFKPTPDERRRKAAKRTAKAQAAVRHQVEAAVQQRLAQTGRSGLTAQELRDTELELRRSNKSNAEIREFMAALRFWKETSQPDWADEAVLAGESLVHELANLAATDPARARARWEELAPCQNLMLTVWGQELAPILQRMEP